MSKIKYPVAVVASVFEVNPTADKVLVTSDGNVYLADSGGTSYCQNHCRSEKQTFEELTRAQFEKGQDLGQDEDWTHGKFSEIFAFAESKGMTPVTKTNQGKKVLIEEVNAFLETLKDPDQDPDANQNQ